MVCAKDKAPLHASMATREPFFFTTHSWERSSFSNGALLLTKTVSPLIDLKHGCLRHMSRLSTAGSWNMVTTMKFHYQRWRFVLYSGKCTRWISLRIIAFRYAFWGGACDVLQVSRTVQGQPIPWYWIHEIRNAHRGWRGDSNHNWETPNRLCRVNAFILSACFHAETKKNRT